MHNQSKQIFNEKIKNKTGFIFNCILFVAIPFVVPILLPVLRPEQFDGSVIEWSVAIILSVATLLFFLFARRFDNIEFDHTQKMISITTVSILNGNQTKVIPFSGFQYVERGNNLLELQDGKTLVVKLVKAGIGEDTYYRIKAEVMMIS